MFLSRWGSGAGFRVLIGASTAAAFVSAVLANSPAEDSPGRAVQGKAEVWCLVRARLIPGSTVAGFIKSVVEDGTRVRRRQLLVELDASPLQKQLRARQARLEQLRPGTAAFEKHRIAIAELKEDIERCKIYAPRDGTVVYVVPEQHRFGGGQGSIVAEGEPVREGQLLMWIVDPGGSR